MNGIQELRSFISDPPANCQVSLNSDLKSWTVTLVGVNQTTYEGESYRLKFIFPADYPMRPPTVYFLKPIPRHEHVYSNGDICLNLLGKDWQPTMTAQGLTLSILSMLSSAKEKKTPPDNAMREFHFESSNRLISFSQTRTTLLANNTRIGSTMTRGVDHTSKN
jgi:ubiquitin-conjugating enzyme E2 W